MFLVFAGTACTGFAQDRNASQSRPYVLTLRYNTFNDPRSCARGPYAGAPVGSSFCVAEVTLPVIYSQDRSGPAQSSTYQDLVQRQRARSEQEEAVRARDDFQWRHESDPQVHSDPDAPDQSELLKNSHDREFILRNFRTMYVDAQDAKYFSNALMKGALGKNKDFEKLHIRIVDDLRVADTVLKVSYTFAWEYPFELTHRNTTIVLLSGKGEGPFSGPLGAADVARNLVNAAKPWREEKKAPEKSNTDKH
jgi:hypothetical protein